MRLVLPTWRIDRLQGIESIDFPSGAVPLLNDTVIIIKPSVLNVPVNFVLVPGPVTPPPILAIPGIPGNPAANPVIPDIPPIPGTVFYQVNRYARHHRGELCDCDQWHSCQ